VPALGSAPPHRGLRPPREARLPVVGTDVRLRPMAHSSRSFRGTLAAAAICPVLTSAVAQAQTPPPPMYPAAPTAQPSPALPPLETGGLTPPPTSPESPGETRTLYQLERAEREDAGRGLEFVWLNVEAGYEYISLQTFEANSLVDAAVVADSGSAFAFGVGAGVRLIFLTLGARFRLAQFSAWDLWTLNGEVGLHVPLGALEPSFTFSAGYASLGAFSVQNAAPGFDEDSVDVSGFDARVGAALDWYVNPLLSLGAQGSFELLVLSRGAAAQPAAVPVEAADVYERDGDGVGFGLTLTGAVRAPHAAYPRRGPRW
jgi:hypothetical protein